MSSDEPAGEAYDVARARAEGYAAGWRDALTRVYSVIGGMMPGLDVQRIAGCVSVREATATLYGWEDGEPHVEVEGFDVGEGFQVGDVRVVVGEFPEGWPSGGSANWLADCHTTGPDGVYVGSDDINEPEVTPAGWEDGPGCQALPDGCVADVSDADGPYMPCGREADGGFCAEHRNRLAGP